MCRYHHLRVSLSSEVCSVQGWQNMTTNEVINWHRYKHFRGLAEPGQPGDFFNPFDKGPLRNYHELCCPSQYPLMPTHIESEDMQNVRKRLLDMKV
jgi:hypothetical protein